MPSPTNIYTFDISLHLSKVLTKKVNTIFASGEFLENITPITQTLVNHWFADDMVNARLINFHLGQKQAILNMIYLHEILQIDNVAEIYKKFNDEVLSSFLLANIDSRDTQKDDFKATRKNLELAIKNKDYTDFEDELKVWEKFQQNLGEKKYSFIKYALKLATAVGKTFVLNAIIIWQYLNKIKDPKNQRYTSNFLIIAPGVIVYERLLDSLKGKKDQAGNRDVNLSDVIKNQGLFIPEEFKNSIVSFLNTGVFDKNNLKNVRNNSIVLVNWHAFLDTKNDEKEPENIWEITNKVLPLKPGKNTGNSLEVLDKKPLDLVKLLGDKLSSLMIINDEAHHIHENKIKGNIIDVEWQKAINNLQNVIDNIFQVDFTATPYITTGSDNARKKHYFPHIIVDFGLRDALENGLVKLVGISENAELNSLKNEDLSNTKETENKDLDFKAITDKNGKLILSEGQKTMIKIGLGILDNLRQKIGSDYQKFPKMMITCEDTKVIPLVEEHLRSMQLSDNEYFAIHSNQKGEIGDKEYQNIKNRLFSLNSDSTTKVVVSVLMLKEGFDADDICVIVPLRSTSSSILLEQTIGRGLRLMFRNEPSYQEATNRRITNFHNAIAKKELVSDLDVLHIVEHPRFRAEYVKLMNGKEVVEFIGEGGESPKRVDIKLKDNYQDYDMFFIKIKYPQQEIIEDVVIDVNQLKPYDKSLDELLKIKPSYVATKEAETGNIIASFTIDNVKNKFEKNYLQALANITNMILMVKGEDGRYYPILQNFKIKILGYVDEYIKTKLFDGDFNPEENNNHRVFNISDINILEHIKAEFDSALREITTSKIPAKIEKNYFSQIADFKHIEKATLDLTKTIYTPAPYPTNAGGFEKDFLDFLDADNEVLKFVKIIEFKHLFAVIPYINDKNMLVNYYPDFMVETKNGIYIVETKASKDKDNKNVIAKEKAAKDFVSQLNGLDESQRGGKKWQYVIIFDKEKRKDIKDKNKTFLQLING